MNDACMDRNRRILVVDDNRAVHEDFRKALDANQSGSAELERAEAVGETV